MTDPHIAETPDEVPDTQIGAIEEQLKAPLLPAQCQDLKGTLAALRFARIPRQSRREAC